jgi:4'-phosphopantetheinyl transferase
MRTGASLSDLTETGKQFGRAVAAERIATTCTDIAVWQTRLDIDAAEVMRCAEVLSDDEKLRAELFRFTQDRRRFIVARGTLRLLIGEQLDMSPATISFHYTSNGRPLLANNPARLYFNVAHSEERALYVFSSTVQPGVDIEFMHREIDCDKLAQRFFTLNEFAALQVLPAADRRRAFLACWTRKEAVVKATGDGLSMPFDQFEVSVEPDAEPRIIAAHAQRITDCRLYAADVGADYIAAVATYRDRKSE